MIRSFSSAAALLLATGCAQEVTVHIRGGDRPPDPDFLHVARPSAQAVQPGSLVVTGGSEVQRFRIVLRNLRLQSQPIDAGSGDSPGARILGPNAYVVDIPGTSLGGGTFTELIGSEGLGAKGFYQMDIDLSPVAEADVQAQPELASLLGKTFVIEGRNPQGIAFTFESSLGLTLARQSVFRMGLNHNNLDVNISPNTWFATDGGFLDPATADPAVRAKIEENVAASIDVYEDDDMDGNPDPLG